MAALAASEGGDLKTANSSVHDTFINSEYAHISIVSNESKLLNLNDLDSSKMFQANNELNSVQEHNSFGGLVEDFKAVELGKSFNSTSLNNNNNQLRLKYNDSNSDLTFKLSHSPSLPISGVFVDYQKVHINIYPNQKKMNAVTELRISRYGDDALNSTISMNARQLSISKILVNGITTKFEYLYQPSFDRGEGQVEFSSNKSFTKKDNLQYNSCTLNGSDRNVLGGSESMKESDKNQILDDLLEKEAGWEESRLLNSLSSTGKNIGDFDEISRFPKFLTSQLNLISKNEREVLINLPNDCASNFTLLIHYELSSTKCCGMNFFSASKGNYFQANVEPSDGMARMWLPCRDGAIVSCWELEYAVILNDFTSEEEQSLRVASSGSLCRQYAKDGSKNFHFKLECPTLPSQISFAIGLFDSVPIPNAPFAMAFCPSGQAPRLALVVEFLNRAFGFINWYIGCNNFPYPSFYLVFLRGSPLTSNAYYSGANIAFFNASSLFDSSIIDQNFIMREIICDVLASQYFGERLRAVNDDDSWLIVGIAKYLSRQMLRIFQGINDFNYRIRKDISLVTRSEASGLNPICFSSLPPNGDCIVEHPCLPNEWRNAKAYLIIQILEHRVDKLILQKILAQLWADFISGRLSENLLSVTAFLRLTRRISGKDVKAFAEQWIYSAGCPLFSCYFVYNRKKSCIEVDLKQSTPGHPNRKVAGSLLIRVHEIDGVFDHSVHIDDFSHHYEIPIHARAKKIKRRKRLLSTDSFSGSAALALEAELDGAGAEEEAYISPISWIRLDPEIEWIAELEMQQSEQMLIEQLQHDRDVISQLEAIEALKRNPSDAVMDALEAVFVDPKCYVHVRCEAASALAVCLPKAESHVAPLKLVSYYNKNFCFQSTETVVVPVPRTNDFTSLQNYFFLRGICTAMGTIRVLNPTLMELVGQILLNLLRFNDNSGNMYSDNYYLATLISAFAQHLASRQQIGLSVDRLLREFMRELDRFTALETIQPFYHNTVMVAAIEAWAFLLKVKLLPEAFDESRVRPFLRPGNFMSVRLAALRLFFSLKCRNSSVDLVSPSHNYNNSESAKSLFFESFDDEEVNKNNDQSSNIHVNESLSLAHEILGVLEIFLLPHRESERCNIVISSVYLARLPRSILDIKCRRQLNKCGFKFWNEIIRPNLDDPVRASLLLSQVLPFIIDPSPSDGSNLIKASETGKTDLEPALIDSPEPLASVDSSNDVVNILPDSPSVNKISLRITLPTAAISNTAAALKALNSDEEDKKHFLADNQNLIDWNANSNQEMEVDGSDGSFLTSKVESLPVIAGGSKLDKCKPRSFKNQILSVYKSVWDNYDSFPFRYPVDPSVLGYYELIKYPMDLSTIADRISKGHYNSELQRFCDDLRLMFDNCFYFNQPESLIYEQAKRLRSHAYRELKREFPEQSKLIKKILITSDPLISNIIPAVPPITTILSNATPKTLVLAPNTKKSASVGRPVVVTVASESLTEKAVKRPLILVIPTTIKSETSPKRNSTGEGGGGVCSINIAIDPSVEVKSKGKSRKDVVDDDDEVFGSEKVFTPKQSPKKKRSSVVEEKSVLERMRMVLDQIKSHQYSFWFMEPVDPIALNLPTYNEIIKEPMDLGTLDRLLLQGKLNQNAAEFARLLDLIFENCVKFNPSNTVVHRNGLEMRRDAGRLLKKLLPEAFNSSNNGPISSSGKKRL